MYSAIEAKEAWKTMRIITKYKDDKRDGSIVSCVKVGEQIIQEPSIVNKLVMDEIIKIQTDTNFKLNPERCFPILPEATQGEIDSILKSITTGKALSYDLFTDNLIIKENKEHAYRCLKDLWSGALNTEMAQTSFIGRIMGLNKVHSQIGTPKQARPIIMMSNMCKIIEARFLPALRHYLNTGLHRSQTGFTEGGGIEVSLERMYQRIRETTKNGKEYTEMMLISRMPITLFYTQNLISL